MKYNYQEAVKEDVINAIFEHYTIEDLRAALADREALAEKIHDELFCDDSVTGNASGSYFCNAWKAEEALCHNLDLLGEALECFGCDVDYLFKNGVEACDVTIRCYLLSGAIEEAINHLEDYLEVQQ